MSLWWSFILTVFGAAGIFLTYRSYTAYLGPAIGISIQLVWVAYAVASEQWWFIVSALLYGGSHLYGIRKRRRERSAGESPQEPAQILNRYRTAPRRPREPSREIDLEIFPECCDPPPYGRQRFEPDLNLVGNLEGSQREIRRVRKFIQKGLKEQRRGMDELPGILPPIVVVQNQERPLEPGETESQRWGDIDD